MIQKADYNEIKEKYIKEIEEENRKNTILIKFYESFKKFSEQFKQISRILKEIENETGIKATILKPTLKGDFSNLYIYNTKSTIYPIGYGDFIGYGTAELGKKFKFSDIGYNKKEHIQALYLRGILREIGQDREEKLKEELKVLEQTINKYNQAIEILNEIVLNSPKIKKMEYTIREPEIYYNEPTYFLRNLLPLLKEVY